MCVCVPVFSCWILRAFFSDSCMTDHGCDLQALRSFLKLFLMEFLRARDTAMKAKFLLDVNWRQR